MKVAVVAGICVERDAISAAAVAQALSASTHPKVERVTLFAGAIDRTVAVPNHTVHDSWQLLRHPDFRSSDIAIFHWGIRYPMFDALTLLGGDRPRPIILFHNSTPEHLVDVDQSAVMSASVVQLHHTLSLGCPVWTYSEENRRVLHGLDVSDERIRFVPFAVTAPRRLMKKKAPTPIRVLSIGRITPAKGIDVLVEAIAVVARDSPAAVEFEIVGNLQLSDSAFANRLERRIDALGLRSIVTVSTDVDDDALWDRLERAHILVCPSLHEGLCVPVIEAYLAGCRVVASDRGNLRYLVAPPDEVVPAGDAGSLAAAIGRVVSQVGDGVPIQRHFVEAICELYSASEADNRLHMAIDELIDPTRAARRDWPSLITGAHVHHAGLQAST